jgi:hypothetical protein
MPKTKSKGGAISPLAPSAVSPPDIAIHPALALPGTTDAAPFRTLNGRWRTRLRERLSGLATSAGVRSGIAPYLARAEERADVCIGEIAQTTGACGPIAETQVVLGAKFAEIALYYLENADPDTKTGRSDILLARACAETSRLNLSDALKTSATIAAMKPDEERDPLAAFHVAAQDEQE